MNSSRLHPLVSKKIKLTLPSLLEKKFANISDEQQNIQRTSDFTPTKGNKFADNLFPSSFLESYFVEEKIGQGNQAEIFKVECKRTKKFYAGKIYRTTDLEEIAMIEKEAKILKQLEHENIIKYHDFLKDELIGVFVLIMEFFSTLTVETFLKEKIACVSSEQRVFICKSLIETVLYLHSQKIAHKDLNLLNILIDPVSFQIKLIDFGLSVLNIDSFSSPEGNFLYRPPDNIEIFQNPYNADLWSLHLILLSFFIGKKISTKKAIALTGKAINLPNSQFFCFICFNVELLLQGKIPDIKKFKELK